MGHFARDGGGRIVRDARGGADRLCRDLRHYGAVDYAGRTGFGGAFEYALQPARPLADRPGPAPRKVANGGETRREHSCERDP